MEIDENLCFKRWNGLRQIILQIGLNAKVHFLQDQIHDDINVLLTICTHFKENIDLMLKQFSVSILPFAVNSNFQKLLIDF